jgi:hypothetical protein
MSLTPWAITAPIAFSARNAVWLLTPHGTRMRPNTATSANSICVSKQVIAKMKNATSTHSSAIVYWITTANTAIFWYHDPCWMRVISSSIGLMTAIACSRMRLGSLTNGAPEPPPAREPICARPLATPSVNVGHDATKKAKKPIRNSLRRNGAVKSSPRNAQNSDASATSMAAKVPRIADARGVIMPKPFENTATKLLSSAVRNPVVVGSITASF